MAQSAVELHQRSGGPGRVPPHNLEAEESLLGAMLLSRDAIAAAVETVRADDFYKPAHAHVFDAVLALYGSGEPVDPVTVAEELRRAGLLEAIGGKATLLQIQANTPASANASHYARIVEEMSLLRRLITVAGDIAEMGYELPDDVGETLDRAESLVFQVAERRVSDSLVNIHDVLQESLDRLEALYGRTGSVTGVPSGYVDLDEILLGLQPSALVVVAARPAQGKTSFALGAASHVALETRRPTLVFSMEMGHLELTQRLLAAEARVDSKKLRRGDLADADWTRIAHAVGRLGEAPLFIDDNPHCSVMEMRAKARRIKARFGDLGLIVVDYLQLMSTPGARSESRQVEVSELSRGLKILARELEVPVVALSQLNRMPEMRQDKRPMLADLRESGCLTADTRILRADTGETVTLGDLLATGARDVPVWTVDHDYRLVRGVMTHVFPSGVKPVYRLRLRSGMEVDASPNHPFLTFDGWKRLDRIVPGERLAVPRRLPHAGSGEPRRDETGRAGELAATDAPARDDDVIDLARRLGPAARDARGRHHPSGRFPAQVFRLPRPQLALFVRHLWSAHGRVSAGCGEPALVYRTSSRDLATDLQLLLLRFGVRSELRDLPHLGGATACELRIAGEHDRRRFLAEVGAPAPVEERIREAVVSGGGRATEPGAARHRTYHSAMGETYYRGGAHTDTAGPAELRALAGDPDDSGGEVLAGSDLFWDAVESIEHLGETDVYDATVPGTHNFLANGVVVHNSIEQDADVVAFIYRDEVYNPESPDRGQAEIIVAKHRNGPTGVVRLAFLEHLTRFENMARTPHAQ